MFLNSPRVRVLMAYEEATRHFARLQGTPIPVNDIWIASLTVQRDLLLCTRDRHFDCLPQVARC